MLFKHGGIAMMVPGGRVSPGRGNSQCTRCPMGMFLVCSQNSKVVSMTEASERVGEWLPEETTGATEGQRV